MSRSAFHVTESEIVDAVARFGIDGMNAESCESDDFALFVRALKIRTLSQNDFAMFQRLRALVDCGAGIESHPFIPDRIRIAAEEWGRRLANRRASEIEVLLFGSVRLE